MNKLAERLMNSPEEAAGELCWRCGLAIADAAYRVTEEGCVSHDICPHNAAPGVVGARDPRNVLIEQIARMQPYDETADIERLYDAKQTVNTLIGTARQMVTGKRTAEPDRLEYPDLMTLLFVWEGDAQGHVLDSTFQRVKTWLEARIRETGHTLREPETDGYTQT